MKTYQICLKDLPKEGRKRTWDYKGINNKAQQEDRGHAGTNGEMPWMRRV